MKKTVWLPLLILCSKSLIAGELGSVPMDSTTNFKGQYLGLGMGGFFPAHTMEADTSITARLPFLSGVHGTGTVSSNTLFGDVFWGYGLVFNSWYLGPELYFSALRRPEAELTLQALNTFPTESLSTYTRTKLNSWEGGLDGRLGWVATPASMLFIRLGVAFNKIALDSNTTTYTDGSVMPETKLLKYTASKSVVGFRAGAGLEQKLTPRISVRADYIYTYYGTYSTYSANSTPPLGPIINTTRIQLQAHAVMGSVLYNFSI